MAKFWLSPKKRSSHLGPLYTRSQANVQLKSRIPIDAKVEIAPKPFTLGVKAEIEKIFPICPKILINAELYGLVLAPKAEKRIPSNLGNQFATLGGQCPSINILTSVL